ncbi:MAG TPA: transketolase C-terminal domain-containing protein [Verrucomicrobiae bacterium]|nr:transketolase C-terminal domain-containing protein [Verrucomicrobiae bacterium]
MATYTNPRAAYGETLVELGKADKRVVVLDADLCKSTMAVLFQDAFPDRYFEMGIAEANMMSTAAGLAVSGKIAFASSFAVFATGRAYDQIRQTISIGKLNVKICGSSCGLSDYGDGSTHQAIEDVALMSAIPNMTVLTPMDATEARLAVRAAATIPGPVYIRVNRNPVLDLLDKDATFELGKYRVLREGSDVLVLAHGVMVEKALTAAAILEKEGISAKVASVSTMKPFNYDGALELARGMKGVVTAEEHSYIGGLAAATAFALRRSSVPMDYVALNDTFGESAHNPDDLQTAYGLTAENIAAKTRELLK